MESRRFFLGKLAQTLLDAIFPRSCVSCRAEGDLLCVSCFSAFDDRVFKVEDNHLTLFAYGNPTVRDLIKAFKYSFDYSAFHTLQKLAEPELDKLKVFIGDAVLVPVPLSPLRLRERGFNQAELIARWAGEISGASTRHLLKREERSGHQAERSTEERAEAMKKSPFLLKEAVQGLSIVLVDDVWTTGSTLRAAEKVLKDGGAESVRFLTLAKG